MWRVLIVVGVLAGATVFGLWWRARSGRVAAPAPDAAERQHWESLGFDPSQSQVTLVQFSTAFCQPCRATRVMLGEIAKARPGVRHVEVDAESHLDVVRALDIRRTPTVLVVDSAGRIVGRASGQPRKAEVVAAVAVLGA
jgi:thiol-disulfide isomerase/thioredoxin